MIDFFATSLGCQCCIPNGERHHVVETVKKPGRQAGLPWHTERSAMIASQELPSPDADWHVQQPMEHEQSFHSEDPSPSLSADSNTLDKSLQAAADGSHSYQVESLSSEQSAVLGAAGFVMDGMDAEVAQERYAQERHAEDPPESRLLEVARVMSEVNARHSVDKSSKDALDMQQMRFILEANAKDARNSILETSASHCDEMSAKAFKPLTALEVIAPSPAHPSRCKAFSREPLAKLPDNMLVDFLAEQSGAVFLKNTEIVELVAEDMREPMVEAILVPIAASPSRFERASMCQGSVEACGARSAQPSTEKLAKCSASAKSKSGVDSIEEATLGESCIESPREASPPSTKTPAECAASAPSQSQVAIDFMSEEESLVVEPCDESLEEPLDSAKARNIMEALVSLTGAIVDTALEPDARAFVGESLRADPISDNLSELENATISKPNTKMVRIKPNVSENACKTLKPITRMPVETFDIALRIPIAAQPVSMTIARPYDDLDLLEEESFV